MSRGKERERERSSVPGVFIVISSIVVFQRSCPFEECVCVRGDLMRVCAAGVCLVSDPLEGECLASTAASPTNDSLEHVWLWNRTSAVPPLLQLCHQQIPVCKQPRIHLESGPLKVFSQHWSLKCWLEFFPFLFAAHPKLQMMSPALFYCTQQLHRVLHISACGITVSSASVCVCLSELTVTVL